MSATVSGTTMSHTRTRLKEQRPSMARLTAVELRKAVDTRAGLWLVVSIAAITIVVVALQIAFGGQEQRTLHAMIVNTQLPVGLLLPVLGVLSVTSEWSQRTALSTFTLVPGRLRVIAAKALAISLLGVMAMVSGIASGVVGFTVADLSGRAGGGWNLSLAVLPQLALLQWLNVIGGMAFGLLFLSSAPAVVVFYALPIAWSIASTLVPGLETTAAWLDLSHTTAPLGDPGVTGREWVQLLASVGLWMALPGAIGLARVRRAEIG